MDMNRGILGAGCGTEPSLPLPYRALALGPPAGLVETTVSSSSGLPAWKWRTRV